MNNFRALPRSVALTKEDAPIAAKGRNKNLHAITVIFLIPILKRAQKKQTIYELKSIYKTKNENDIVFSFIFTPLISLFYKG